MDVDLFCIWLEVKCLPYIVVRVFDSNKLNWDQSFHAFKIITSSEEGGREGFLFSGSAVIPM